MRRQTLIALGVAIILGLVAVFLANSYLTGRERQLANSPEGMVRVAVAALPLAYGTEITPDKVKFVNYPADEPAARHLQDDRGAAAEGQAPRRAPADPGQPAAARRRSFRRGAECIDRRAASRRDARRDGRHQRRFGRRRLRQAERHGRRADHPPANRRRRRAEGRRSPTCCFRTSASSRWTRRPARTASRSCRAPRRSKLTPVDAQKIALGQQLGQLSLVLRKPGEEQNIPQVETVSLDDLRYSYYGGRGRRPVPARPPSPPPPRCRRPLRQQPDRPPDPAAPRAPVRRASRRRRRLTKTVDVTRGTQTRTYEVGGYDRLGSRGAALGAAIAVTAAFALPSAAAAQVTVSDVQRGPRRASSPCRSTRAR